MAFASPAEHVIRRMLAALPELTLAWSCYRGALDALAGHPTDVYLWGLMLVEVLSLAWLRLITAPAVLGSARSWWQMLLGVGGTGVAAAILLLNGSVAIITMVFTMMTEPRTFVLLLLALTRRSIWSWAWGLRSVEDAARIAAQGVRAFRVHYLAIGLAFCATLLMDRVADIAAADQETYASALWLAGMAGYFVALALYLLLGRTPLHDPAEANRRRGLPDIAPFALMPLLKRAVGDAPSYLGGVLLLWGVVEVFGSVVPAAGAVMATPILIGLSAWLLIGAASHTLELSTGTVWAAGKARAAGFGYPFILLWLLVLLLSFLAVPVVYGAFSLDLGTDAAMPARVQLAFVACFLWIFYIIARLWPATMLCYVLADTQIPESIVGLFRLSWRLTAGFSGLKDAALPGLLAPAASVFLMLVAGNYPVVAKIMIYTLLAPVAALVALERTQAMVTCRPRVVAMSAPMLTRLREF